MKSRSSSGDENNLFYDLITKYETNIKLNEAQLITRLP